MSQMSEISTILGRQGPSYSANLQVQVKEEEDDDDPPEEDCSVVEQPHRHHHFHDVLSVSFFFLGSVVGLILSIWDLTSIWDLSPIDDGDDDDDWVGPSLVETNLLEWDSYDYLAASVPSLYLLSSMTHIRSSLISGEHTSLRELLPFLSFGLGSILELTAAFIDSDEDEIAGRASHAVSITSNLLYLVFSIHIMQPLSAEFMLETVGSISVLLGTLVDTFTSMFVLVFGDAESITLYSWYLVSAGLWFLCAGLYIVSNIKEHRRNGSK